MSEWINVDEQMPGPGVVVLAFFVNKYGRGRVIRAHHARKHTIEACHWDEDCETDDTEDGSFEPEGWYEDPAVGETMTFVSEESDGKVSHWMPLPAYPVSAGSPLLKGLIEMSDTNKERDNELHAAIMNLPAHGFDYAYKEGHRDARHAAAELVLTWPHPETPALTEPSAQVQGETPAPLSGEDFDAAWPKIEEGLPSHQRTGKAYSAFDMEYAEKCAARDGFNAALAAPMPQSAAISDEQIIECAKASQNDVGGLSAQHIDAFLPTWRRFANAVLALAPGLSGWQEIASAHDEDVELDALFREFDLDADTAQSAVYMQFFHRGVAFAGRRPLPKMPDLRYHGEYRRGFAACLSELQGFAPGIAPHQPQPEGEQEMVRLLSECLATLRMWSDVAPAVSLCADIERFLNRKVPATQPQPEGGVEYWKDRARLAEEELASAQPQSELISKVQSTAPGSIWLDIGERLDAVFENFHNAPNEVLSVDNPETTFEVTSRQTEHGRYFGSHGFMHGPGFKMFANDFPAGTKLIVTARIEIPEGEQP